MSETSGHDYRPALLTPGKGPERSTAGAFLVRDGAILLERRPKDAKVYPGYLDTPGGHVEPGETPEEALARELHEELGIRPLTYRLGAVQDDRDRASGRLYRHFVYIVESWEGEPASRENRRIEWIPIEAAARAPDLNPLIGEALGHFREKGWFS